MNYQLKRPQHVTLISLDPLAVSQSSFLHPPQCVKQSVSARINDNNILSYTGFGNNLQIFSQTVREIGEQEVHIHHTSRSRKFDRSAFKMSGGCRGSHIPILSSAWEFILSECDTPRYMCKLWKEKKQRKSQNNVVNLLSQIKSPRRLDLGEPSWKGRARIRLGESFISVNIWEVCFSCNSFWNQNEKGHNRHKAQ